MMPGEGVTPGEEVGAWKGGDSAKKWLVPGEGRCDGSCSLFRLFLEPGLSRRVSKSPNCANVFTCLLRAQAGLTR